MFESEHLLIFLIFGSLDKLYQCMFYLFFIDFIFVSLLATIVHVFGDVEELVNHVFAQLIDISSVADLMLSLELGIAG